MSKAEAIERLAHKIAVTKASADNENYDIGLTIKEGEQILSLLQQPEPSFNYSKTEVQEIIEGVLHRALLPERGDSPAKNIASQIYYYLAIQKIKAETVQQPEPEAGEFTEDIRRWLKEDSLSYGNAVTKLIQACDRLDRQAQEKAEAAAAWVQAENECCVLRGGLAAKEVEIEKLKEENKDLKGRQRFKGHLSERHNDIRHTGRRK